MINVRKQRPRPGNHASLLSYVLILLILLLLNPKSYPAYPADWLAVLSAVVCWVLAVVCWRLEVTLAWSPATSRGGTAASDKSDENDELTLA